MANGQLTLEAIDKIIASRTKKTKTDRLTERERLGQRIGSESLSTADSLQLMNEELRSGAPASQTRFIPENLRPLAKQQEQIKAKEKIDEARAKVAKKNIAIRSKQVTNAMGRLRTALKAQSLTEEGTPEGDLADQDVEAARKQLDNVSGKQFGELETEVRGEFNAEQPQQDGNINQVQPEVDFSKANITLSGEKITSMQDIIDFVGANPSIDIEGFIKALSAEIPEEALRTALQK